MVKTQTCWENCTDKSILLISQVAHRLSKVLCLQKFVKEIKPCFLPIRSSWSNWGNKVDTAICIYCCCSGNQACPTLCDPMDFSTSGLPVPHRLPEFTLIHLHRVGDAIQPSHPLTTSSSSALNLSQHQGLFQWVFCSHQMTEILELQLQHQSYQCPFSISPSYIYM